MKRIFAFLVSIIMITELGLSYTSTVRINGAGGSSTSEPGNIVELIPKVPISGWQVTSGNTTVTDNKFIMPEGNAVIEGIAAISTYTISYNANGGSGAPGNQTKTQGTPLILSSTIPTKDGYDFLGWNTDQSATTAIYQPGSSFTADANTTLYAIWEEDLGFNRPLLVAGHLTPVNWNGTGWVETNEADWDYNYDEATKWENAVGSTFYSVEGNGTARWANAKTADGSLYVWIPRFTYYVKTGDKVSWNADTLGSARTHILFSNGTTDYTTDPSGATAYTYSKNSAFSPGGVEITGFWVAKYEASKGSDNVPQSLPAKTAWVSDTISNMYTYGKGLNGTNTNIGAHMLKDSEWGAVAYLTSALGRIPYINNHSSKLTGYAGPLQDSSSSDARYLWNTENGVKGSTTHNVYGVYDMSGGVWEYTSAYYSSGTSSYHENLKTSYNNYGTKYVDVYEAYATEGNARIGWDSDYATVLSTTIPVFGRSGLYADGSKSGVFDCYPYDGISHENIGFRVALFGGHTITYDANGGTGAPSPQTKSLVDILSSTRPTRDGYIFLGWSMDRNATVAEYQPGGSFTRAGNTTLYAIWKIPETYTVTYNSNGGTFDTGTQNIVTYADGEEEVTTQIRKISKTPNINDEGNAISNSYEANQSITDTVTIPGATSLEVTITYQTQGTSYDWVCVYDGTTVPTSSNYSSSISKKLGGMTKTTKTYTISGDTARFYFKSNDSSNSYYGYYAVVTASVTEVIPRKIITSGAYKKPSVSGYTLLGWSESTSATVATYPPDNSFSPSENTTLYAVWIDLGEVLATIQVGDIVSVEHSNSPYSSSRGGITGTLNASMDWVVIKVQGNNVILLPTSSLGAVTASNQQGYFNWYDFCGDVENWLCNNSSTVTATLPRDPLDDYRAYTTVESYWLYSKGSGNCSSCTYRGQNLAVNTAKFGNTYAGSAWLEMCDCAGSTNVYSSKKDMICTLTVPLSDLECWIEDDSYHYSLSL